MSDLLLLTTVTLATYVCSVGFTVVLFRIFFPLKTKEEMERIQMAKNHTANQLTVTKPRAVVTLPMLSRSRRLA